MDRLRVVQETDSKTVTGLCHGIVVSNPGPDKKIVSWLYHVQVLLLLDTCQICSPWDEHDRAEEGDNLFKNNS